MTNASWSVAVLVSAGRHPATRVARACCGDAVAMALGRRIAGDALRVVHAGSPDEPALQDYLALGAGTIAAITVKEGHDVMPELIAMLRNVDLILTGCRTEQGAGSGLLPYALAQALGRPLIANVLDAEVQRGEVRVRQFLPKGQRRAIAAPLPAVLAVHPLAPATLTYAYARRVEGRIVPETPAALQERSEPAAPQATWTSGPGTRHVVRLKAEAKLTGHARMQAATGSRSKGGVVAIEGSCVDKAQMLLSYLREHRLVDF